MQTCVKTMHGIARSVGRSFGISTEAGHQAQQWVERHGESTPRALAVDEPYGRLRGKASVNGREVHRGHVGATIPPVAVDGDRWTLVWWSVPEQGITRACTASDGGLAMAEARSQTQSDTRHHREVWHLLPDAARVQGPLNRAVQAEHTGVLARKRMEKRCAHGIRRRGRPAKASMGEQEATPAHRNAVADPVRSRCAELQTVWEVVVVRSD
jgi:hypothetical protein